MQRDRLLVRLDTDGAERHSEAMSTKAVAALRTLADSTLMGRSGIRLFGHRALTRLLDVDGEIGNVAAMCLGDGARPVRAIMFDKTADANWSVPWHQDRTIAVRARHDIPGFGPWSTKSGVAHVEPPFEIMQGMVTIRAHLDDCDIDNAPLLIASGSHRLGRVQARRAAEIARTLGQTMCLASAGEIWVYATAIVHASERARAPRRRRVLQVDFSRTPLPDGLEWLGVE
jgi:hypothetical protein